MGEYKICSRCVMDTTSDPNLVLDEHGVCNYCHNYDKLCAEYAHLKDHGEEKLSALFEKIKEECRNDEYDLAVGLSGGVDSSYLMYLCHQYNLRVLAVHVDAGWNSELAVQNIEKICSKLGYDLHTVVIDWATMKELQRAYMFSGLGNLDVPQDHCFIAATRKYCKKHHIKYLVSGWNLATEGILSRAFQHGNSDWINIKDVYKKCGRRKVSLRKYPHINFWDYYYGYPHLYSLKTIYPLFYVPYSQKSAIALLENEFGWKYYGSKHFESRFTRFFQEVYLPNKFGWEKRRDHIASLIVGGEMTREEGLAQLSLPSSTEAQLKEETEYVLKKLDISEQEWKQILDAPVKMIDQYKNEIKLKNIMSKINSAILKIKRD